MKIQKFLFATMLCGVFGVFTACSDDVNPVTGDIDTTDPVGEEVETVLAIAANVDNGNFTTRADTDPSVNQVQSLAIATFYVDSNDEPGNLISLQTKSAVSPDNQGGDESRGYYMDPIKFKIAPDKNGKAKVAVVALANYGTLFDGLSNGNIKDFETFKAFTSAKMYNNHGTNYYVVNGEGDIPVLYPMSSNVLYYEVYPGKVNSIGYRESSNALAFTNTYYNNSDDNKLTESYISANSMIDLYRGAAEIELRSIKFENYGNMQFDNFILEEVFVMNVPTMVNWFDPTLPGTKGYKNDWGGDLNEGFDTYLMKNFTRYFSNNTDNENLESFLSGNRRVNNNINGSIPFVAGEFCSEDMFDNTSRNKLSTITLMFPHNVGSKDGPASNGANSENSRDGAVASELPFFSTDASAINDYYGRFLNETIDEYKGKVNKVEKLGDNVYSMRKNVSHAAYPAIKFAVSPSNYSLGESGLDSEKAICLVVRGRYFYRSGNQIIGPDNTEYSDSRYYTVIVNKEGELTSRSGVPAHSNCVKRNVRYEISLTISGPGSKTPWGYDKNAYVVPKVRIVPFGLVEQDSKLD